MKKFFYHYSILVVSLLQSIIWFIYFYGIIDEIVYGYADASEIVILTIFIVIAQLLLSWLLDGGVRGFITVKHMVFTAFLVSPIRPILQIISLVVLHKSGADSDFGERRDYNEYNFKSWIMYVLFSSEAIRITASGAKYVSPKEQRRRDEARATYERVMHEQQERKRRRANSLANMKSNSSYPSVIIAPLVLFGNEWRSFRYFDFSNHSNDFQIAQITSLKVDGVELLEDDGPVNTTPHLYLRSGSYEISISFKVKASGKETETCKLTHTFKGTKSMTVDVYDGETAYLALVANLGYTWTKVTTPSGSSHAEDMKWAHDSQLTYSSKEKCDAVFKSWNDFPIVLP